MVVIHSDGDRLFIEYEFTSAGGLPTDFQTTGRFVGGTGKFKNMRGRWTEKGRSTVTEDATKWVAEY